MTKKEIENKELDNNKTVEVEIEKAEIKKTSKKKTDKKNIKKDKPKEDFKKKYNELNDKFLRLNAEYDNFRKRSLKEKMEIIKSAGDDILINILPVIDNFERAMQSIENSSDIDAIKEGVHLIYNNFKDFLAQRGVKEIEALDNDFDTDLHEAISKIPSPTEEQKGKVIDVIEKGYLLHEKIIRFAKVVVGD